jgi:hypothetical protein
MFRDDAHKCEAIRVWLGSLLESAEYWTERGPTQLAIDTLESSPLSSGQRLAVRMAFDIWNGDGKATIGECLHTLDTIRLRMLGSLLLAVADEEGTELDRWIALRRCHYCGREARDSVSDVCDQAWCIALDEGFARRKAFTKLVGSAFKRIDDEARELVEGLERDP